MEKKVFTTNEALQYLGCSQSTFTLRIRELGILPANHNPMLRKQRNLTWHRADLDKIKGAGKDKPPPRQVA